MQYSDLYKSHNQNMRIKNLELNFGINLGADAEVDDEFFLNPYKYYSAIYIDGRYIRSFEIDSVHNRMEYSSHGLNDFERGLNQFEIADYVVLEISKEANQRGNKFFASTFDYIAHSGCGVKRISFDLIDMKSRDPERTTKHYDFNVDCNPAPNHEIEEGDYEFELNLAQPEVLPALYRIQQSNLNQKVGMDSSGDLWLVISEKYGLTDVCETRFIDLPDVIEYDDKFDELYHRTLLAILNPNKLRVLHFDERDNLIIQIDRATIECDSDLIGEFGPYYIVSSLLDAIYGTESLYKLSDIDRCKFSFKFTQQNRYNKNSLDMYIEFRADSRSETWADINITEFIPELIAEIQEDLDYWSEFNENNKDVLVHLMKRLMELYENKIGLN